MAYFTASCDPYEGEKGNKAFAESLKLDYPILSDPDKKVAEAYGVLNAERGFANRWTFYIDKEGVHVDTGTVGNQDTQAQCWRMAYDKFPGEALFLPPKNKKVVVLKLEFLNPKETPTGTPCGARSSTNSAPSPPPKASAAASTRTPMKQRLRQRLSDTASQERERERERDTTA